MKVNLTKLSSGTISDIVPSFSSAYSVSEFFSVQVSHGVYCFVPFGSTHTLTYVEDLSQVLKFSGFTNPSDSNVLSSTIPHSPFAIGNKSILFS